jgi:predicted RNA binding protein YcfA (HicA-like mRNA interferase family)
MSNVRQHQTHRACSEAISPVVSCRMNAAAKLLASMRRNQLDWQIGDLQTVARQIGLDWRHQKSSHCVFVREDGRTLSVPAHRPIKPIYVRKFVELIDGA